MGLLCSREILVEPPEMTCRPPPIFVTRNAQLRTYKLRKRSFGGCGVFWRSDPTGKTQLLDNADWPRDGAFVQGEPFQTTKGETWVKAHKVKQVGQTKWMNAPEGAFLPFEPGGHYFLEEVIQ